MKPIPFRQIRRTVRELSQAADDVPQMNFYFEIDGMYGLDKAGEIGLAATAAADLPGGVPVDGNLSTDVKKSWQALGAGAWRLKIWRDGSLAQDQDGKR